MTEAKKTEYSKVQKKREEEREREWKREREREEYEKFRVASEIRLKQRVQGRV